MEDQLYTPNPTRTFVKKVTFKVPTETGAETVRSLPVTFQSMKKSDLRALQDEGDDDMVFEAAVIGVDGVGDGHGNKLDLKEGKKVMAQESAFVFEAVVEYQDAMLGGNLKPKTSRKRRGTG